MLGYKIATHFEQYGNDIDDSGYEIHRKVLVILDIPDDVERTTPDMRYSKAPLGLTNTEFNEWASEAQNYKKHTDEQELFHDFKNFADDLATYNPSLPSLPSLYIHIRKCRAAKAKVVKIIDIADGTPYDCAHSVFDRVTVYRTGETVIPDAYDDNYLAICSHGIHYFESPEVTMLYHATDLSPSEASAFLNHAEGLLKKLRKEGDI